MVEVVGHKLVTHHPVIEPVSAAEPGTEICDAETARKSRLPPYPRALYPASRSPRCGGHRRAETVAAAVQWGQSVIRS